jgi:hypothetical protein
VAKKRSAGAKALLILLPLAARLKSGPVTKLPSIEFFRRL